MKDEGIPSANNFALQIEEMVWQADCSYVEAICIWCEERGLEPEMVASLVKKSAPLKAKIQVEAEALNLIVREHGNSNTLF
jgi:hypothetical protein